VLAILIPSTITFLIIDLLRIKNKDVKRFYNICFKSITRSKEKTSLTGASYVLIASVLSILIFDKEIAIISLLIMTISDTMAAIIGRRYGKVKINKKTLEGSIAFFLFSLIIVSFFDGVILVVAFIAILLTTLAELFLNDINDNLTIPTVFGGSYSMLVLLFNGLGIN
tara:strand:- start:100 stop:603 length:504 start_codon:yes stop_codon:yes gene_type:complete